MQDRTCILDARGGDFMADFFARERMIGVEIPRSFGRL